MTTLKELFKTIIMYVGYSSGGDGDALIKVREPKNFKKVCDLFLESAKEIEHNYIIGEPTITDSEFHVAMTDQENYTITTNLDYDYPWTPDVDITIWGY